MKLFVLVIASLLALANADVSHLFNGQHDHHHHHHDHHHHDEHHDHHAGYSYEQPSVPFELPKATYLPPEPPTTPKAAYLPPETPAPTYLPPKTTRAPPPPPPPPRTTTHAPPPPPPPAPKNEYLPPPQPQATQEEKHYEIPLPSYADSFLEPDSPHLNAAPAQPESTYLPPEPVAEHSNDGYHYDAPAKRFRF